MNFRLREIVTKVIIYGSSLPFFFFHIRFTESWIIIKWLSYIDETRGECKTKWLFMSESECVYFRNSLAWFLTETWYEISNNGKLNRWSKLNNRRNGLIIKCSSRMWIFSFFLSEIAGPGNFVCLFSAMIDVN